VLCCVVLCAARRPDHEHTKLAKDSTPIDYPKPDGVTTFDVPTSLFRSGTATAWRNWLVLQHMVRDWVEHLLVRFDRLCEHGNMSKAQVTVPAR
jgi:hypothetical protein